MSIPQDAVFTMNETLDIAVDELEEKVRVRLAVKAARNFVEAATAYREGCGGFEEYYVALIEIRQITEELL